MWVPSMKHLHCLHPLIFVVVITHSSHALRSYFMPSFSPCFIRTDFTQYSRRTSPAYYMRAPATPRHTHPLPLSPSLNLRGQRLPGIRSRSCASSLSGIRMIKSTQQDSHQQQPCVPHPLSSSFLFFLLLSPSFSNRHPILPLPTTTPLDSLPHTTSTAT